MRPRFALALLAAAAPALALPACTTVSAPVMTEAAQQAAFWQKLTALCGKTFQGKMLTNDPLDADMAGRIMVMEVASCTDTQIRIPFHVGPDPTAVSGERASWDRSRTWVLTRTASGIQLKHDHRHADGTPDEVTNYGGTAPLGGLGIAGYEPHGGAQHWLHFPVDAESIANFRANGLDKSVTNVWSIALGPITGATTGASEATPVFTYRLRRTGAIARLFTVGFW